MNALLFQAVEHGLIESVEPNMINTKYIILAIGFTGVIVYMSSIPGRSIPGHGLSSKIISNLAHIPAYALITILWLKAFKREFVNMLSGGNILLLLALCLFAALDEVHQAFVPGRTASTVDIGLDVIGIIFGFCIFRYVKELRYSPIK